MNSENDDRASGDGRPAASDRDPPPSGDGGSSRGSTLGRGILAAVLLAGAVAVGGPTVAATVGDAVTAATGPIFGGGPDDGEAAIREDGNVSIAADHVAALVEAGSVDATLALERDGGSRSVRAVRTTEVNLSQRRLLADNRVEVDLWNGAVTSEPLRIRQYGTPDGTYTRTSSSLVEGNYTRYDENATWSGDEPAEHFYAAVLGDAEALDWTRQGRERYDGVEVVRYAVADPEGVADLQLNLSVTANATGGSDRSVSLALSNVTVTGFEGTLLIDTDGVVRYLGYEVEVTEDGDPVTYVGTLSFTDVGNTTVSSPDWTAAAAEDG